MYALQPKPASIPGGLLTITALLAFLTYTAVQVSGSHTAVQMDILYIAVQVSGSYTAVQMNNLYIAVQVRVSHPAVQVSKVQESKVLKSIAEVSKIM
jgi:hypothetical protein